MALTADDVKTCRHGHPLTGDNVVWATDSRDATTRPTCRTCRNERSRDTQRRERKDAFVAETAAREALTRVAPDPTSTCKANHLLTADNLAWGIAARNGKPYWRCRQCKNASTRRWQLENGKAASGSMIVPRQSLTGKVVVTADQPYTTVRLWRLFGPQFRDRVSRALADERVDPLQRRVLERAANGRYWTATSTDMASRLYLEALLAETLDARSDRLRIEVLLGLLWP